MRFLVPKCVTGDGKRPQSRCSAALALDKATIDHDVSNVFTIRREQLDVLNWITIHNQQVSECSRFHHAQFPVHLQDLRIYCCSRMQNLKWRQDLTADRKLGTAPRVLITD